MASNEKSFHLGYLRSLDGLRGVLILMVLLNHGGILYDGYGFFAVNTFFVLSGFLITCLLVLEYNQSNTMNLPRFYLRRALRLLPALVAMLLVFTVLAFLSDPRNESLQVLHQALWALFYSTNLERILEIYPSAQEGPFIHTWSLSLEEQFYFAWPALLLFLLRRNSRNSLLCWLSLGAFLSVCLRATLSLTMVNFPYHPNRLDMALDTRADSLLSGCLVGVLISSNLMPRSNKFAKVLRWLAAVSGIGLLILGNFWVNSEWMIFVGWLLASIFAAILIAHLASASQGLIHWIFNNPVFIFLGRISYALYVWHVPILIFTERFVPCQHLIYLIPTFIAALASYYLIEKPCLRLKTRFAQVN